MTEKIESSFLRKTKKPLVVVASLCLLLMLSAALPLTPIVAWATAVTGVTKIGNDNDNTLRGGAGQDHIEGRGGSDTITGRGENDQLWGYSVNDNGEGVDGNDIIYGGDGEDSISGQAEDVWK
jgi:Ca2+-binding RTX toxin-like protein